MLGREHERSDLRFPRGRACLRRLDPVVHGIAQHVDERLVEFLDHRRVDLDVLAGHDQPRLLAELVGQVADQPRQAREHGPHRLGPDRHDALLQLPRLA
jgi:hypothetical protein